ncbi:hypothetical protein C8P66_108138 [Humitalea rosea]|uniref:HTH Mu-type domain-containing protein n=1 Tax=Humitalea rosea TaxID=990373 RepID=A0A2W7KGI7_9PROT|nr:hypothetical protein [Humitalea rosea]PZW46859.1 hypothetical protein C8P66_108138 [Humitalea rosea]
MSLSLVSPAPPLADAGEWFTAAELAGLGLPYLPDTPRGMLARAHRCGWLRPEAEGRLWRRRVGRGGGAEIHLSALPIEVQAKLLTGSLTPEIAMTPSAEAREGDEWAWFERLPEHRRTARWLQAACGAVQDGQIGPRTLAAAANRGAAQVYVELTALRTVFLARQPNSGTFGLGWSRRMARLGVIAWSDAIEPLELRA